MDSRLLNVFHDDPFEGNYVKYENDDDDFWSKSNEALDLQLSETLHGILPIEPAEVANGVFSNAVLKDDFPADYKDETSTALQKKNALYNAYIKHCDAAEGTIEVFAVNRPAHCGAYEDDLDDNHSNATFRTRTDSSSIGDYESHSSDYDDDDDGGNAFNQEDVNDDDVNDEADDKTMADCSAEKSLVTSDDFDLTFSFNLPLETAHTTKNRTISTNTNGSDVDVLGVQIDANTFDLTDFITKDDFGLSTTSKAHTKKQHADSVQNQPLLDEAVVTILPNDSESDSDSDLDSDAIVDVETVEVDAKATTSTWTKLSTSIVVYDSDEDEEEDVPFVDNIKCDPPWSPHQEKNTNTNAKLLPNKRQCEILKNRLCSGRSKAATPTRNGTAKASPKNGIEVVGKKMDNEQKVERTLTTLQTPQNSSVERKVPVGIGLGGKNLSLISKERQIKTEQGSQDTVTSTKDALSIQAASSSCPSPSFPQGIDPQSQAQKPQQAVKRKLNLEEYKKRRGEMGLNQPQQSVKREELSKTPKIEQSPRDTRCIQTVQLSSPGIHLTPAKHSEEITAIVRSLKEQGSQNRQPTTDPIIEARNKVLRMQELKRAQQLKIIDSAITAKVPRVTKLLPLKDIVGGAWANCDGEEHKGAVEMLNTHREYEEIILVSASCNTEITIPPDGLLTDEALSLEAGQSKGANRASRSLLKSSVLLYNITNSLQKVQATENVRITTNSLISSIQDVIVKNAIPMVKQAATDAKHNATDNGKAQLNAAQQHGEDKIIMHLRKDSVRKPTVAVATQTEFPLLPLPRQRSRERVRHKSTRKYRKHLKTVANAEASSDDANALCSSRNSSYSSSTMHMYRSRSRSMAQDDGSSSTERMQNSDGTVAPSAVGGFSTPSSRRHRSSVSSSYSESERLKPHHGRSRRSNYKERVRKYSRCSSTSSMSDYSERDRDRSRSPYRRRSHSRSRLLSLSRSRPCLRDYQQNDGIVERKEPAVEERRIVYVGRIESETTKEMLRRKFLPYGNIKQITIHYKETGMKYGFVTYDRCQDAFTVIDNSARDPHINMYDISFGGRRAFCRASYADLDNAGINTYQSYVFPKVATKEDDSFETLLLKVKAKMNSSKATASATTATPTAATMTASNVGTYKKM